MIISIIAAIGKNNELGKGNQLLWKIPADMKHFKEITSGHPVIMGRKTFESIGIALPNRRNIIITRDQDYKAEGIETVHSLKEAFTLLKKEVTVKLEVFIIGGAEIYKQAMDYADKLYITKINAEEKNADAFFPAIGEEWQTTFEEQHPEDEINPISYSFINYERIS